MKKFQADPEAAERWMDESDLAPELRQAIVEGAQRLPRQ
jgi:hypothetical protein